MGVQNLLAPPIFGPPDSTANPSLLRGALVWFHYDKSRSGDVPNQILKDYQGAVHTDAYAGYNQIYLPDRCLRVACLAHIRRKFLEVEKIAGKEVSKILSMIAQLYKLVYVCHLALALGYPLEDLEEPPGSYPARGAFAAALVHGELEEEFGYVYHAVVFVHYYKSA